MMGMQWDLMGILYGYFVDFSGISWDFFGFYGLFNGIIHGNILG